MLDTFKEFNKKVRSGYYDLVKSEFVYLDEGGKYIFYLKPKSLGLEERLNKLTAERDELKGKVNKLGSFLKTSECHALSQREQYLLARQWNSMSDYLHTLEDRIKLIEEKFQ